MRHLVAAVVCAASCCAVALAQRPFTPPDLGALASVGDPRISPDGETVAYTLRESGEPTRIMLVPADGSTAARALVEGSSPRWSPDGATIAYRGGEDEQSGIWLIDGAGGEPRFLVRVHSTDHFLGHRAEKNFVWLPDGSAIAYVGAEAPDGEADPNAPIVIDRILFKTRTGFSDNRRTHVWLADVATGATRCLTPGAFDEHSIDVDAAGERIAFISNRSADPDDNYSDDLFTVSIETGRVERLTDTPGTEFSPRFAPAGDRIAFLGTVRPVSTKDSAPENTKLYLLTESGERTRLAADFDRRIGNIAWARDGGSIWFTAGDRGSRTIYRAEATPGGAVVMEGDRGRSFGDYSMNDAGTRFAYTRSAWNNPGEIRLYDATTDTSEALTAHNGGVRGEFAFAEPEEFWFESFDGTPVQGWVMRPIGFEAGREHPTILSVHGGPHGMYGVGFSSRFQAYAGAGYGVVFINPRGSTGYGQAFADGTLLNWGGGDYKDLMLGLDHAIAAHDWIDEDRLGVVGGSYGGFMTNWIITQTDRFDAAVSAASVSNLVSFYGASLYHLLIETEFNGRAWENYSLLWQWSPLAHVASVTTPTLFLHGADDHDVPIEQAEEMFVAMKKLGVETVLVRYPGEGHGFLTPENREDALERTIAWFDAHLLDEGS